MGVFFGRTKPKLEADADLKSLHAEVEILLSDFQTCQKSGPISFRSKLRLAGLHAADRPGQTSGLLWRWARAALSAGPASVTKALMLLDALSCPELEALQTVRNVYRGGVSTVHLFECQLHILRAALTASSDNSVSEQAIQQAASAATLAFARGGASQASEATAAVRLALGWLNGKATGPHRTDCLASIPILMAESHKWSVRFGVGPLLTDDKGAVPDLVRLGVLGIDDKFLGAVAVAWDVARKGGRDNQPGGLCWFLTDTLGLEENGVGGASGGAAMAAAFRSALRGVCLKPSVAISAEIDLSGALRAVDGVTEKRAKAAVLKCSRLLLEANQAQATAKDPLQPAAAVQVVGVRSFDDAWHQLMCRSFRRAGLVALVLATVGLLAALVWVCWPKPVAPFDPPKISDAGPPLPPVPIQLRLEWLALAVSGHPLPNRGRTAKRLDEFHLIEGGFEKANPIVQPLQFGKEAKDSDQIELAGRFNRPTAWWVVWIDTNGDVQWLEESDQPTDNLRCPRDEKKGLVLGQWDPPGTHLLLVVTGPPGSANAKSLAGALTGVGRPVKNQRGTFFARGKVAVVDNLRNNEDRYLEKVSGLLPPGVILQSAVFFDSGNKFEELFGASLVGLAGSPGEQGVLMASALVSGFANK
jgi:hypothetical protein